MSLRDKVKEFEVNLPLMEGREKGDLKSLYEDVITINEYGFLKDDENKDYVVFNIKEDTENFYFGGMVLTEQFKELEADGYRDEIEKDGLPIRLTEKTSKNKRKYTHVEYYPDEK